MSDIREIHGRLAGTGRRFGLVASRFNERLVEQLVAGAVDCLVRHGVAESDLTVVRVPGAWEIPLVLERLAVGGGFDGLVALGVVIRGETPHFEYICAAATAGAAEVARRHTVPVGLGILTCADTAQAEERAGGKSGNKGWDAALAALEMADVLASLSAAT